MNMTVPIFVEYKGKEVYMFNMASLDLKSILFTLPIASENKGRILGKW